MPPWTELKLVEFARGIREISECGRRHISWRAAFVMLVTLVALALDNHLARSQGTLQNSPSGSLQVMSQTWSVEQGAPETTHAIAQTADGYLWLGGSSGLFRFDGTRFARFRPSSGDRLLRTDVHTLFAPPAGGLWVGYLDGGFSYLIHGRVTNYGIAVIPPTGTVYTLAQDSKGILWAGTGTGVWKFDGAKWQKLGTEWDGPTTISNLGIDRTDTVWVITGFSNHQRLLCLPSGSRRFLVVSSRADFHGFTLDADQKVLTGPNVLQQVPNRGTIPHIQLHELPLFGKNGAQVVDRTNAVWTVNEVSGLTRIGTALPANDAVTATGTTNDETQDEAASSQDVRRTLVDREGNIWYADEKGLHRFFYVPFVEQEFSVKRTSAIAGDNDGSVWIGFFMGPSKAINELYRVTGGHVDTIRFRTPVSWGAAYRARDNTVWFGGRGGLWHLVRGRPFQVALPKEMAEQAFYLQAMTEDRAGGLWVSFLRYGLYRFADGVWTSDGQRKDLPTGGPYVEFTDSLGRVWFGYSASRKIRLAILDGKKLRTFGLGDGAPRGNVTAISGRGPNVWIGSEFGLQMFDGNGFHAIHAVDDDWLLGITGIVERANGDLWLNGLSGIFHISKSEIAEALKNPSYRVKGEHFGTRDGLPGLANQIRALQSALEGSDGRLWFSLTSGVVWLDPNQAQKKATVPPIAIQSVSADDKNYEVNSPLNFPARTSSVEIGYSAISLSDPEAVRSRVRLHETDTDWHEVTTAGPVEYRNLRPGHYHFSVEASDTDGVWSGKAASIDFTILPAYYQTVWFRIFCVALFAGFLWALYLLRVRSIQRRSEQLAVINAKLETQVAENANLYSNLQRSEAFLAQGQKISHTGSFGRNVLSEKLYWSEETYEIYELDRSVEPTVGWLIQQIHPEDRVRVQQTIESAIHQRTGFDIEYRLMTRGGSVKYLHVVVQARENPSGELEFVGAVTDITERKRAEEALRQAQGDLARINRVTTMGELTASLAHEVSQPISGTMTNANVCLRSLGSDKPDLDLVRTAVTRIARDAQRAAGIIARIRSQFEKGVPNQESLNVNEIIPETVALLRDQAARYNISVRTELAADLPQIVGDRVQLLQVAMNLIVNSIEAMKDVDGLRELVVKSQRAENDQVLVSVSDTGIGLSPQLAEQIFDPFFTTKPHGTGMGLRISRTIVESHGGRLSADPATGRGATFRLSLPAIAGVS